MYVVKIKIYTCQNKTSVFVTEIKLICFKVIKGAQSYLLKIPNFWKFCYHKKKKKTKQNKNTHKKNIFSRKLWQILQMKMFRLEDFNDNVSDHGSHKQV